MKKRTIFPDQSFIEYRATASYYLSSCQREVYQSLITGFREEKILFSLTGESGLGKSFLMECITNELGVNARLIKIPQRSDIEIFDVISKELGIDFSKEPTITDKNSWLIRNLCSQLEQHIIIQVDHAQSLTSDSLSSIINWVKLISAEKNHLPSIHIVLLGLQTLPTFFELENKIICQCQLKSLNNDEIPKYIHSYLERLGKVAYLFEHSALERIIFHSRGIPRLINKLCDLGLLIAELEETPSITATAIDEVADNCLLTHKTGASPENRITKKIPLLSKTDTSTEVITESIYELKDRKIINKADNSSINYISISTRKIFIFGLAVGLLFGVGGSILFNQGWLNNRNKIISYSKQGITQVIALQQKVKELVISSLATNVKSAQNKQQQPHQESIVTTPQIINDDELQFINKQKILAPSDSVDLSERIDKLFNQAERQLTKKQLMTPVEDNAWETYHDILSLDANNKQALISKTNESNVTTPQVFIDDETQKSKLSSDNEIQIVDKQKILAPSDSVDLSERIGELFNQAERQLAKKQLMTPVEDNALETYHEILSLDANNKQALIGINSITKTYVTWAWVEIQKENFQHAEFLFNKALKVSPNESDALKGLAWLRINKKSN